MNDVLNMPSPLLSIEHVMRNSAFKLNKNTNAESCSLAVLPSVSFSTPFFLKNRIRQKKKKKSEVSSDTAVTPCNKSSAIRPMSVSFNGELVQAPLCASPPPGGSPGVYLLPWRQQREHRALVCVGFRPQSAGLSFSAPVFFPNKWVLKLCEGTFSSKITFLGTMNTAIR